MDVAGVDMDYCMASSPVQDVSMSSSTSRQSFADSGSQESISMQCTVAPNLSEVESGCADVAEEKGDPVLPSPLEVKIADLGNACWVVSCGHFNLSL